MHIMHTISPAEKKVYDMLLAFGVITLAFGICMGLLKEADSPYMFLSLGISVALFGAALVLMMKTKAYPMGDSGVVPLPPAPKVMSAPEAKRVHVPEAKALSVPKAAAMSVAIYKAEPTPAANSGPPALNKDEPPAVPKSEPKGPAGNIARIPEPLANFGVTMDSTLAEILLAAIRKDPIGTARILALAIAQPAVPIAAAQVSAPKGEPLP